jgi:hypothetical protein
MVAAVNPEEAKKAYSAAIDALSGWRNELADVADRNSSAVYDKMGAAAKTMGWPAEMVDMTKTQMQQGTKMQLQMLDQVMDVWAQQAKNPGTAMPGAAAMPSMPAFQNPFAAFGGGNGHAGFPGMPDFTKMMSGGMMPGMGAMPGMPDFTKMMMGGGAGGMPNPMQFWMQAAEACQKNWAMAMQAFLDIQKSAIDQAGKGGPFAGR